MVLVSLGNTPFLCHWQSLTQVSRRFLRISRDGRMRAYGSRIEYLSPPMDGGRVVSESLVTCSPCSRIGCHVAVERATQSPFPLGRSLYQGPRAPLDIFSLFPFTWWCRALGSLRSYGRKAYVKPVGLITPRARTHPLCTPGYSPASVQHP